MNISIEVQDEWFQRLKIVTALGNTALLKEALTLFSWAVEESLKGRVILSATAEGNDSIIVTLKSLTSLRPFELPSFNNRPL